MVAFRKSNQVLVFVLLGAALVFVGEAAALSDTPDIHVPQTNSHVHAIVQSGNTVYVGGNFTQIGGNPVLHLAGFDAGPMMPLSWIPVAVVMLVVALLVVVRHKARPAQQEGDF